MTGDRTGPSTAGAIAAALGAKGRFDPGVALTGVKSVPDSDAASLTYAMREPDLAVAVARGAGLTIVPPALESAAKAAGISYLVHTHPKYAIGKAAAAAFAPPRPAEAHPTAILGPDVTLGANVGIGPYTVLEGKIDIADGVYIEPHCLLQGPMKIGANTIIRAGCRIGYEPFSFGRGPEGDAARFPPQAGVVIGEGVEIFHNVSIARGIARDTIIEDHVTIGNHAHLGNQSRTRRAATICAHTDISARTDIGEGVWVAQSAAVRQGVVIGAGTMVGMGAVVVKDVGADETVTGVPARARSRDG